MRIGELAKRAGTTTRALRFYESQGLITARREANGYREYSDDDARLVAEILALQAVGMSLDDTRPFVECLRAGHESGDSCTDSIDVYRRRLAEVDALLAQLTQLRTTLADKLRAAEARPDNPCRAATRPDRHEGILMSFDHATAEVVTVTDETFAAVVLQHQQPVLVDFWAPRCPPCHMIAPVLAEVARERFGDLIICKINSDENPDSARDYQIMSLPSLVLFRDGRPVRTMVGARSKARLQAELDAALRA
ncbi:thioredoxin [Nocardia sp. NPDC101769]|uniref:thioredoxin n=1 Tax=Nocardia sp. NPDC101769 TaxID=3364333 RepID=UPI0038200D7C